MSAELKRERTVKYHTMRKLTNFDKWMRHINNVHYANTERMTAAYDILTDNEKVQHSKLHSI